MKLSESIFSVIAKRSSWRTYSDQPLSKAQQLEIEKVLSDLPSSNPFPGKTRFSLFKLPSDSKAAVRQYGTYGFISGAQFYILGAVEDPTYAREHFAFALEHIILKLTDLGYGTCWLGGTYNKDEFNEVMKLNTNEIMPAITPVGIPETRRLKERIIRGVIRAKRRYNWNQLFFNHNFTTPLTQEAGGKFANILEMVRLAPSAKNRQPWRILFEPALNQFHFYLEADQSKMNSIILPMQQLDIGIAVAHFSLAIQEMGITGTWSFNEPTIDSNGKRKYIISWTES